MWEFWRGKLNTDHTSPRSNVFPLKANDQRGSAVVNFKDLNLSVDELPDDVHTDSSYHEDEDPTNKAAIIRTKGIRSDAQKNKLIIIMVGLPGRGKTFLCNKLKCYLNWLGHNTSHFNVGNYRRLQKEGHEMQDASFFDSQNKLGLEARSRALMTAIDDVMSFLTENNGQVDIFDATNTTTDRRQMLIATFHGRCQYIFIESICNDTQVLENNYRYKMKYSPDYQGLDTEVALNDFKERIAKYNEVYEPINDRRLHYIKLIDMIPDTIAKLPANIPMTANTGATSHHTGRRLGSAHHETASYQLADRQPDALNGQQAHQAVRRMQYPRKHFQHSPKA